MNDNGALPFPSLPRGGPVLSLLHLFHHHKPTSPPLLIPHPPSNLLEPTPFFNPPMEFHRRNHDGKRPMTTAPSHLNYSADFMDGDAPDDDKKRTPLTGGGPRRAAAGAPPPSCQAERCTAVLTEAKRYHRRHKVCEFHAKAPVVIVAGLRQRFCQQCSRFHELSEFDEAKRSCRRRLAGHNERRRKSTSSEPVGEGSSGGRLASPADHQMKGKAVQACN